MIDNAEQLKAFFDKLVTQLDILQTFFLDNQQRLITLERLVNALYAKDSSIAMSVINDPNSLEVK